MCRLSIQSVEVNALARWTAFRFLIPLSGYICCRESRSKELTNPYAPPTNSDVSGAPSNPAKILLYLSSIGWLCLGAYGVQRAMEIGVPLSSARHRPGLIVIVLGITAFWLASRRYDRFARWATVLWGSLATRMAIWMIEHDPRLTTRFGGIAVAGTGLLLLGTIVVIAFRNRPNA